MALRAIAKNLKENLAGKVGTAPSLIVDEKDSNHDSSYYASGKNK
ncbi:MAG TPA: hypothetical protein VIB79_29830 [Candidatus Binatia bacterium]|jgi:hypothetical protein